MASVWQVLLASCACLHVILHIGAVRTTAHSKAEASHYVWNLESKEVAAEDVSESGAVASKAAFPEGFEEEYPRCSARLKERGYNSLEELWLSDGQADDILRMSPTDCGWWESEQCRKSWADRVANEHVLRMSLVGQPDPRGPTLYTPSAQAAVLKTMHKQLTKMYAAGEGSPTLEFMTEIFRGTDVEDEGSWKVKVLNTFAGIFNRGGGDTQYRGKEVKTRFYDLSKWGKDMDKLIPEYNDLEYDDQNGKKEKALRLSYWYGMGTSFVYKYPSMGIEHELQKILDEFVTVQRSKSVDVFAAAERWIRNMVILHPFTDSNGRSARVSLNTLFLLNDLPPIVMERQDEDMSASPADLRERICEGMIYGKELFKTIDATVGKLVQPQLQSVGSSPSAKDSAHRCCKAHHDIKKKEWCVSIPMTITCEEYADVTQSKRYLDWQENDSCWKPQDAGECV